MSRAAGRAVLASAGNDPNGTVRAAAAAGASVVLLAGDNLPAGALEGDDALTAPVLGVPSSVFRLARSVRQLVISVGAERSAKGSGSPRVAGFSSWGLAFGGHPKPEVAGPGVGVLTVDPGTLPDGSSRFVLVDGASAAAAVVAGQAAIAVQTRPALTATQLRSLLVGTAQSLPGQPEAAQGNGLVDLSAAATAELVAQPATIAFGRVVGKGWTSTRTVTLRNISTRWLKVFVGADSPASELSLTVSPRSFTVGPGGQTDVHVTARLAVSTSLSGGEVSPVVSGALTVAPLSGTQLRVPWAVVTTRVDPALIGTTTLSAAAFKPSDAAPAVLDVQLGRVDTVDGRVSLEPVTRLDIHLLDRRRRDLGLLARVRDVLPGSYAFGLTGRGPHGGILPAGRYSLRLLAFPAAGGPAVTRSVVFTIR
jgi:hypothetical protein